MQTYQNYLMDMDGVLLRGRTPIPGAERFINRLNEVGTPYLVLTNNPLYTPGDLAHRLQTEGLHVPVERIFTSALAAAAFLHSQRPSGKAFVIGESGLTNAIHDIGYVITDHDPDYVVLGETHDYNISQVTKAIRLITTGAAFLATNPDPSGPAEEGIVPAYLRSHGCADRDGERAQPPLRGQTQSADDAHRVNYLGVHSEDTVMIGDRMDTDIYAGITSGMETILVLTGVTRCEDVSEHPYVPTHIVESIADLL